MTGLGDGSARGLEKSRPGWLLALFFGLYLYGVAVATVTSHYAPLDLALLALIYGLLGAMLAFGGLLLARIAAPLGVLAGLAAGALLVWHLREQTVFPATPRGFALVSAAVGIACSTLLLRLRRGQSPARLGLCFGASVLFFAVWVPALFYGSTTFRWHLLRHNKLIGTPAYYLLADPVAAVCAQLWAEKTAGSTPEPDPVTPTVALPGAGERPNLLFVLLDTLRADGLAAYGGASDLMPRLNRFAEESWVFADVLANATWTRPSVASFLTGLLPEEHGAVDRQYRLPEPRLTLAEILEARGYETAAFVSNYGAVGREAGFSQGFGHFEQLEGTPYPYARAEHVNEAVRRWLVWFERSAGEDREPVFLYLHYLDPHPPYLSGGEVDMANRAKMRPAYDEELRYLDRTLFPFLDEVVTKLAGPTFVFVASDHGEEFGEHGESGHGHSLYGEVLRLPVILRTPGGEAGTIRRKLEGRDFFDLLLRLASSPDLDVRSWAEQRGRTTRYASIYSSTPSAWHRPYLRHVCMRAFEEDDLFVIWSAYGSSIELYDLSRDRRETWNLERGSEERTRAKLRAMDASVDRWAPRLSVDHSDETVELLRRLGYVE